jgi:hypothetical protein
VADKLQPYTVEVGDIQRVNRQLDLTYQSLKVHNDLSHFPVPFYDPRDNRPLTLPMISGRLSLVAKTMALRSGSSLK